MNLTPYYDDPSFNYQQYWREREYENQADQIALKRLLSATPKAQKLIDIGAGFGRLTGCYCHHAKTCVLVDPSQKMLDQAHQKCHRQKNLKLIKAFVEKLPFGKSSFDTGLMIRTFHHLKNPEKCLAEVARILKPQGYFILEFANKIHFKARFNAWLQGKIDRLQSLKPVAVGQKRQAKVPFINYHPQHVIKLLEKHHFQIIETLSVSNFRNPWCKKLLPLKILLFLEKISQKPYATFWSGPSIFVLAQKREP